MVKIPTYSDTIRSTQAKSPISRNRPMLESGASTVFDAVADFADTAGKIATEIKRKNDIIKSDTAKNEMTDLFEYGENEQPGVVGITEQTKTDNNNARATKTYLDNSRAWSDTIYNRYLETNPAAAEWFKNYSAQRIRNSYTTVETNSLKNARAKASEDTSDLINLYTNQFLDAYKDQNKLGMVFSQNHLYGNNGSVGIYDMMVKKGIPSDLDKDAFNANLRDNLNLALAKQLIDDGNLKAYDKFNQEGIYNSLDTEKKLALDKLADVKRNQINNNNIANLVAVGSNIKDKIKKTTDIFDSGYMADIEATEKLLTEAVATHEQLLAVGKSGLANEITELQNSIKIFNNVAKLKILPTSDIKNAQLAIQDKIATDETEGGIGTDSTDIQLLNSINKILNHRNQNEDNYLSIAQSAGLTNADGTAIQTIDFTQVNFESEEFINSMLNRRNIANAISSQFQIDPQFFFPVERQAIQQVFASGDKENIQNLMLSITTMAGDNAPLAFAELGTNNAQGIAHIGTLQFLAGPNPNGNLANAIDAYAKLNNETTKNDYKLFQPDKADSLLLATGQDMLSFLKDNQFANDTQMYNQIYEGAKLIFYGMLDQNPDIKNMDSSDDPEDNNDVNNMWEQSIKIAAGENNGFGGLQDYYDNKIIIPSWLPVDVELDTLLPNIMTDELFDKISSGTIVEPGNDNREVSFDDILGEDDVSLYAIGDGVYVILEGDVITSQRQYADATGQMVTLDLNLIKNEMLAYINE